MGIDVSRKTMEMSKLEYQKHGHNHKFKHRNDCQKTNTEVSAPRLVQGPCNLTFKSRYFGVK